MVSSVLATENAPFADCFYIMPERMETDDKKEKNDRRNDGRKKDSTETKGGK